MFVFNPFALAAQFVPSVVMQVYLVLMIVAVAVGTSLDTYHKGSAKFFARRREKANALAERQLGSIEVTSLAARTIGEAATSGELGKSRRRMAHLLMMYGFFLYVITTIVMVFADSSAKATQGIVPALWDIGALMVVGGGMWFFFYLRVNVAYDGASPLSPRPRRPVHRLADPKRCVRADLAFRADDLGDRHRDAGRLRPLRRFHDAAIRFGVLVEVRPYVLQARGGVPAAGRGGKRRLRPPEPRSRPQPKELMVCLPTPT